jgi:hypothetical protein
MNDGLTNAVGCCCCRCGPGRGTRRLDDARLRRRCAGTGLYRPSGRLADARSWEPLVECALTLHLRKARLFRYITFLVSPRDSPCDRYSRDLVQRTPGIGILRFRLLTHSYTSARMINRTRTVVRTTQNRWPAATGIATGRMSDYGGVEHASSYLCAGVVVSIEAITWVLEQADIPSPTPPGMPSAPALTAVLLGLANHASRHGAETYPSVRRLAGYARISERQVQRCLKALVSLGLISHGDQERVAAMIPREDRRPVLYNLSMKRGDLPPPRSSERGDKTTLPGVTRTTERGDAPVTRTVLESREEPAALRGATNPTREAPRGRQQSSPLDQLATACRRAGLTARFDTLTPTKCALVEQSIALHGIEALVRAALDRHRPWDSARSAAAWIPVWQSLQPPRPKLPPRCGRCDEYGWLPDDELGRAVRCPCRQVASHRIPTSPQETMLLAA